MNTIGLLFIFIYCILIFMVLEICVSMMIITGLEPEVARFQVVSMLTATGFTTKESELIARHPIRRKISIFLILFGVFSFAVILASLSQIIAHNFRIIWLTSVSCILAIVLVLIRNKTIELKLRGRFHEHLQQEYDLDAMPVNEILYIEEEDLFTSVQIEENSAFIGQKNEKVFSGEEDILLLYLRRGEKRIRHDSLKLTIQEGDCLFLYGSKRMIEQKFKSELESMRTKKRNEQGANALVE